MKLKKLFGAHDMTEGTPWIRIMEFAIPMLIGNIAQQLYNTADSVIVGRYVGDNALAAVGASGPILLLLLALFAGIATGAGIVVSQYFGAKDREGLGYTIGNCLMLSIIASVVIMILGPVVTRPMLILLKTPDTILDWSAAYLTIFFVGIPGFFFYNILSGILRGMGDSVSALVALLLCTVLNVFLDILFIAKLGIPGVAGVSLATVIAQAISAVLCYVKLMQMKDVFHLERKHFRLKKHIAGRVIRLGIPGGITQAVMAMANLVVQSLINSMGELVIAAMVILMRVDGFAMMPNMSFGMTMSVYTGQNVGAGRLDRIHKGLKEGMVLSVAVSSCITILLLFFGRYLFAIFTNTEELISLAVSQMRVLAVGYIAITVTQVVGGVLRGAGDTVSPMWISILTTIVIRVPVAYFLTKVLNGNPVSIVVSLLVAWCTGTVLTLLVYRYGKKWRKALDTSMTRLTEIE